MHTIARLGATLACALTLALTSLVAPGSAQAAVKALPTATSTCTGVWVVVDRGDGKTTVRCATKYANGYEALKSAGLTVSRPDGYLCSINAYPTQCASRFKQSHYWSYWHAKRADNGSWGPWVYSGVGPKDSHPSKDVAEGWLFTTEKPKNLPHPETPPSRKPPKVYPKASTPKVTGTAKVGKKLTATAGSWSPRPTLSYRWYRSGKAISKATKSSYTLKKADAGRQITVKVTGKKSGWETRVVTSAKTAKVKK